MYNRYIPQSDGSFRKNQYPDAAAPPTNNSGHRKAPPPPPCPPEPPCPPPPAVDPPSCEIHSTNCNHRTIPGFLRQLLPADFDTGDLLIVLLLLLMAGDCEENQSNALLTLALYLFL